MNPESKVTFIPRFYRGVYRDCKWCQGRGCLSCPVEAEKQYKREFPDGPKPILTIPTEDFEKFTVSEATGGPSIEDAHGALGEFVSKIFERIKTPSPDRP